VHKQIQRMLRLRRTRQGLEFQVQMQLAVQLLEIEQG
jgi:hypothetical protein